MKYIDPITKEKKTIYTKASDTLPLGAIVDFDGEEIPAGWEEIIEPEDATVYIGPNEPTDGQDIWIQKGKNLFYEKNAEMGYYEDGGIWNNATDIISYGPFYVKGTIYISANFVSNAYCRIIEFKKDGTYVKRTPAESNGPLTLDSSTDYIIVSNDITLTNVMITLTEEVEYEPYVEKKVYLKNDAGSYDLFVKNRVHVGPYQPEDGEEVWVKKGKNLIDPNNVCIGYINDSSGNLNYNSAARCTGFVEIEPGKEYYFLNNKDGGNWGAWYDENKNRVAGINFGGTKAGFARAPHNAKYLRFTLSSNNNNDNFANNTLIAQSSQEVEFEPYVNKKINTKNNNGVYEKFYNEEEFSKNTDIIRQKVNSTQGSWQTIPYDPTHKFLVSIIVGSNNSDVKTIPIDLIRKFEPSDPIKIIVNGTTITQLAWSNGIVEYIWTSGYKVEHYTY